MDGPTNPVTVGGISFVEFSGNKPHLLDDLFKKMEFIPFPKADQTLYALGEVRFISNPTTGGSAEVFRKKHIRGASALGFKVEDSDIAFQQAIALGATKADLTDFNIPAIQGIGASIIYLVDDQHEQQLMKQFGFDESKLSVNKSRLMSIDHLTHNLNPGGIARISKFYGDVFGFVSTRHFDIDGQATGLISDVIQSPDGSVIIPLNESKDDQSQIAEFVKEYNGEGIQHIALLTDNIKTTVSTLEGNGIPFQYTPDTYYELIDSRLPGHGQDVEELKNWRILIDGGEEQGGGHLLQIFTQNSIGPIFFEFIERIGNNGFGEGNFKALFESIELDQIRRGAITHKH